MRITSIELSSCTYESVAILDFRDPGTINPYVAKRIIGLDAEEIIPRFYGFSDNPAKKKFFSLSQQSREIVLSILLNPSYGGYEKSYADLRDDIYRTISASRTSNMWLKFFDGQTERARISGFVTKVEYDHFSNTPQVDLTLNCPDPTLRAPTHVDLLGYFVEQADSGYNKQTIYVDDSTAPHGFKFTAQIMQDMTEFRIASDDTAAPDWTFHVKPRNHLITGDWLEFSSEAGNKYLKHLPGGETGTPVSIVDKVVPGSIWPILFPGENSFVFPEEFAWRVITYLPTYWGI